MEWENEQEMTDFLDWLRRGDLHVVVTATRVFIGLKPEEQEDADTDPRAS